jgi:hypothetical protein
MERKIPWVWIVLGGFLLLAPGTFGRLFLDLAEGLTLTVVVLPLILGIGGFVGWQLLQRRFKPCPACGFVSSGLDTCPACGTSLANGSAAASSAEFIDASTATIDVEVVDDERN